MMTLTLSHLMVVMRLVRLRVISLVLKMPMDSQLAPQGLTLVLTLYVVMALLRLVSNVMMATLMTVMDVAQHVSRSLLTYVSTRLVVRAHGLRS